MKYPRRITERLVEALTRSPAVLLTGARQTGKTTLVEEIGADRGYRYVTFDDLFAQGAADADPAGFVEQLKKPVILDEAQLAPKIFQPIKRDIDKHRHTGSSSGGSTPPF